MEHKGTLMLSMQGQQPNCEVCLCQQHTKHVAQFSSHPNMHSLRVNGLVRLTFRHVNAQFQTPIAAP